jgi:hypothetical protein
LVAVGRLGSAGRRGGRGGPRDYRRRPCGAAVERGAFVPRGPGRAGVRMLEELSGSVPALQGRALFFRNCCSIARPGAVASAQQLRFLVLLLESSAPFGRFEALDAIGRRAARAALGPFGPLGRRALQTRERLRPSGAGHGARFSLSPETWAAHGHPSSRAQSTRESGHERVAVAVDSDGVALAAVAKVTLSTGSQVLLAGASGSCKWESGDVAAIRHIDVPARLRPFAAC